jgi:hypothetical protein
MTTVDCFEHLWAVEPKKMSLSVLERRAELVRAMGLGLGGAVPSETILAGFDAKLPEPGDVATARLDHLSGVSVRKYASALKDLIRNATDAPPLLRGPSAAEDFVADIYLHALTVSCLAAATAHRLDGYDAFWTRKLEGTALTTAWLRAERRRCKSLCAVCKKTMFFDPVHLGTPLEAVVVHKDTLVHAVCYDAATANEDPMRHIRAWAADLLADRMPTDIPASRALPEMTDTKTPTTHQALLQMAVEHGIEKAVTAPLVRTEEDTARVQTKLDRAFGPGVYGEVEIIGKGGFGVVAKAKATASGKAVALKVLDLNTTIPEPWYMKRTWRELHILKKLRGAPGILRLTDLNVVATEGSFSVCIETPHEKHDLHSVMVSKSIALGEVHIWHLMHQLMHAVAFCHDVGVIHRDVCPRPSPPPPPPQNPQPGCRVCVADQAKQHPGVAGLPRHAGRLWACAIGRRGHAHAHRVRRQPLVPGTGVAPGRHGLRRRHRHVVPRLCHGPILQQPTTGV